jgi:hypothetical protein
MRSRTAARFFGRRGVALVVASLTAPPAGAFCPAPTPVFHGLDSRFVCPDSVAHGAFVHRLIDPAGAHSVATDILCETIGEGCFSPASGVAGDRRVTIETDWATRGSMGARGRSRGSRGS